MTKKWWKIIFIIIKIFIDDLITTTKREKEKKISKPKFKCKIKQNYSKIIEIENHNRSKKEPKVIEFKVDKLKLKFSI